MHVSLAWVDVANTCYLQIRDQQLGMDQACQAIDDLQARALHQEEYVRYLRENIQRQQGFLEEAYGKVEDLWGNWEDSRCRCGETQVAATIEEPEDEIPILVRVLRTLEGCGLTWTSGS